MQNSSQLFEKKHADDAVMCNHCYEGHMKKLQHPHSFDFNRDGYVPRVCNECGACSDIERIIKDVGTMKNPLSNNFMKKVLSHISYSKRMDYTLRKELELFFKKKKIFSLYNFAYLLYDQLSNHKYIISFDYILKVIYQKYKPLHAYDA